MEIIMWLEYNQNVILFGLLADGIIIESSKDVYFESFGKSIPITLSDTVRLLVNR